MSIVSSADAEPGGDPDGLVVGNWRTSSRRWAMWCAVRLCVGSWRDRG